LLSAEDFEKKAERLFPMLADEAKVIEDYATEKGLSVQKTANGLLSMLDLQQEGTGEAIYPWKTTIVCQLRGLLTRRNSFSTLIP